MQDENRKKLAAAHELLTSESDAPQGNYVHCQKLESGQLTVSELSIENLGTISAPVSKEDFDRIKRVCQIATYGEGCNRVVNSFMLQALEIDGSNISVQPSSITTDLVSMVTNRLMHLEPADYGFKVTLDRLILYEAGGHYNYHCSPRESGVFAKITLPIPVDGGHTGGRLNIYHPSPRTSHKILFGLSRCDQDSFLTAFYSHCPKEMEPITKGSLMILEFSLRSKSSIPSDIPPTLLPNYFSALSRIKESLSSWADWKPQQPNCVQTADEELDDEGLARSPTTSGESSKDCLSGDSDEVLFLTHSTDGRSASVKCVDHKRTSERETVGPMVSSSNDGNLEKTLFILPKKEMLIFLLRKDCCPVKCLDFVSLSQVDRTVCELFQSIDFLDVHLATVAHVSVESGDPLYWIEDWYELNKSIPLSPRFRLDAKTQVVDGYEKLSTSSSSVVHHSALVIQPRNQSVYLGCIYNFELVYSQLCSLSRSPSDRDGALSILGQVFSFWRQEPYFVFQLEDLEDKARRFMDLCTKLEAKKEGIELLGILADRSEAPNSLQGQQEMIHEGVRDLRVAQAIADFQCRVAGWEDCENAILNLIHPGLLPRQLTNFVGLVFCFLQNGCIDGALKVAQRLTSLLCQHRLNLEASQLNEFIDLVLFLENEHPLRLCAPGFLLRDILKSELLIWNQPLVMARISGLPLTKIFFHEKFESRLDWARRFVSGDEVLNYSDESTFLKGISDWLMHSIYMERFPALAESWSLKLFTSLISKLPMLVLSQLFVKIPWSVFDLVKTGDFKSSTMNFMLNRIISEGPQLLTSLTFDHFVDLFECFVRLGNQFAVQFAVSTVCKNSLKKDWDNLRMIEVIFSSLRDFESPPIAFDPNTLRNTITSLMTAWVEEAKVRRVDPNGNFECKAEQYVDIFEIFVNTEKKWPRNLKVKENLEKFSQLFVDFPFKFHCLLAVKMNELVLMKFPELKEDCGHCFDAFVYLCQSCFAQNVRHFPSTENAGYQEILKAVKMILLAVKEPEEETDEPADVKKGKKRKLSASY